MLYGRYIIPVLLAGTIMFLIFLFFIVMYVLIYRRRRQETEAKLANLDLEHNNQLLITRLEEQERAMTSISREIHDNVSQQIDLLTMYLKAADEAETEHERKSMLSTGKTILSHVSNDLRNASYSLNGSYIKLHGLHAVLERALSYIRSLKKMICSLTVQGVYRSMPPEAELLIFRIAQEALRNSIKHSDASNLNVTLNYGTSRFIINISDNGVGFCMNSILGKPQTLGIQNMNQRAELLKAKLNVTSAPAKGCSVTLQLDHGMPFLN